MKLLRLFAIVLMVALLASCAARFSKDGISEKAYIDDFLETMQSSYSDDARLLSFVSPEQLKKLGAGDDTLCNAYACERWEIVSYNYKSGDIGVMIYGSEGVWQHLLTFRLVKEDEGLYLTPMQFDEGYVDPWFAVEENVGREQKELVAEFLQHMIDDYNDESLLLGYISPAYCDENNIDKSKFKCNAYSPVGFTVGAWDAARNTVEAYIWGEDEGWRHQLTFKLSEENGRLYFWPGNHSETYIDPWFTVQTNM